MKLHFEDYENLPKFGIYSDQVIDVVVDVLSEVTPYLNSDRPITASMINNYVKQGLIEKPEKKKYQKSQIIKLIMITLLKEVFSMEEIKKILEEKEKKGDVIMYGEFVQSFKNEGASDDLFDLAAKSIIYKYKTRERLNQ